MRLAIFAFVVALAALAAVPGLASHRDSGIVIGSTSLASNQGTADLTGKNMPVFQGDASGAYVTSSPVTGVISSWSFRSAGVKTGDRFVLRVLSPQDSSRTSWRAVATSRPVAVTSPTGTDAKLGPFPESILIQKGERVALQPLDEGYTPIEQGVSGKDGIRYFTGPLSDGSASAIDPGSGADNGQIVPIQATITTGGGGSSIASTAGPTVGGTPAVGSTLSCTGGSWSQKPDSLAFAWLRDGSPIAGATTASYAVAAGDAGHALSCKVTATASGASASAASTAVQVPAASAGPANTAAPKVVGIVKAGSTVRCDPGTWTGNPTFVYAWTWQRSAPFPAFRLAVGSRLFGATTGTYYRSAINRTVLETAKIAAGATLEVPDLPPDGQLTCTVSVSAGSPSAAKAVTATATPAPIQPTPPVLTRGHDLSFHPPAITAGLGPGSTNTCHPGLWSGYPTFGYDWYSLGPKPTQRLAPRPRKLIWKGPSLKLGAFHEGMTIECTVTATNEAGSGQMSSNAYVVPAAPPQPTNGVFVSVSTESPSGQDGLVGPGAGPRSRRRSTSSAFPRAGVARRARSRSAGGPSMRRDSCWATPPSSRATVSTST